MGNVMPERPVAWAGERRPYTAEELMAFRDKVHKSLKWVHLSEECPTGKLLSFVVAFVASFSSVLTYLFRPFHNLSE